MVEHAYSLSCSQILGRWRQENHLSPGVQANRGNTKRCCKKEKKNMAEVKVYDQFIRGIMASSQLCLESFALQKLQVIRIPKEPYVETGTGMEELRPPVNSYESKSSWKQTL